MLWWNAAILSMKASSSIESGEKTNNNQAYLKIYKHLIGKLIIFACGTRLDISFILKQLSRYNLDL